MTEKEKTKRSKLSASTTERLTGTVGTATVSINPVSVSGGTIGVGYPAVAYPSLLQHVEPQYPSTAQPERLVDYHARADIDEIKSRLIIVESKFGEVNYAMDTLSARLNQVSGSPQESVSKTLSNLLHGIAEVRAAYLSPTSDGYQVVLTYPDSIPLVEFLRTVVPIEIEIDKRYKNIYFDFEHIPESDFSIRSFPDAKPLQ